MITQKLLIRLLLLSVLLPVALCVVMATGHLLRSMDDILWGNVLFRIALAGGIVWLITLIVLLLTIAARLAGRTDLSEEAPPIVPNDKEEE